MSDGPRQQLARLAAFADADTEGGAEDLFADPRWQELAAGTASPETVAELEALAEAAGMPEAMELFAPLPEGAKRDLGWDWHAWQALCACVPAGLAYSLAMYARRDREALEYVGAATQGDHVSQRRGGQRRRDPGGQAG